MGVVKVEIPIDEEAAVGLGDPNRLEAVGRLVSRLLKPTSNDDPFARLLDAIGDAAEKAGLTEEAVDQELAAWKAERAARRG
jgi:hypothetical protein